MGKIRCPKRGGCNTKRSQRPSTLSRQNKPGIINWWPRMSSKRQFYLSPRNLTGWQTDQCDCVGMKLLGLVRFIRTASVPRTWAIPVWLPNIKQGIKAAHGYAVHPWKKQTVDDTHRHSHLTNGKWGELTCSRSARSSLQELRRAKSSPVSLQCHIHPPPFAL